MFCFLFISFVFSKEMTFYDNETRKTIINNLENDLSKAQKDLEKADKESDHFTKEKEEIEKKLEDVKKAQENIEEDQLCAENSYLEITLSNVDYPHEKYNIFKEMLKVNRKFNNFPKIPEFDGLLVQNPHPNITFKTKSSHDLIRSFALEASERRSCQLKDFRITLYRDGTEMFSKKLSRPAIHVPTRFNLGKLIEFDTIKFDEIETYGNQTTLCFPSFVACSKDQPKREA